MPSKWKRVSQDRLFTGREVRLCEPGCKPIRGTVVNWGPDWVAVSAGGTTRKVPLVWCYR